MRIVQALSATLIFVIVVGFSPPLAAQQGILPERESEPHSAVAYVRAHQPELLSYEELVELGESDEIRLDLKQKMTALLETPFLSNEAHYQGAEPIRPEIPRLGPSLRMVMWNIERGLRLDGIKLAFSDGDAFLKTADSQRVSAEVIAQVRGEMDVLRTADVLVLQEVDWGMKRTEYREVVRELAELLNMNWAYAVEFLEVDPIDLGIEMFEGTPREDREQFRKDIEVDKERYRGLHGTAVLSRYPIREARVIPLLAQGYDWYHGEKSGVSRLEAAKRATGGKVFLEKVFREIRRGGRTHLFVTLDVPDLPGRRLTVSAPHLEARTKPSRRREQMREVLSHLSEIEHPVILAGDLNTTLNDSLPTSVKREIYKRVGSKEFWTTRGLLYATGLGLIYHVVTGGFRFLKNQNDPTARHIPIFASNPERGLFDEIEGFRDPNGYTFDFRGDSRRTVNGTAGTLANSNQRGRKGFIPTFELARTVGPVGKLKLDWIFVKSYSQYPHSEDAPYRFGPHFAQTMEELNFFPQEPLSDHNPISVDLPFGEPSQEDNQREHP
jgi:endonuclease/exonuclease/phosphatase family metal-dependent hydrolase